MKTTAASSRPFWNTARSIFLQSVVILAGATVLTAAEPAPAPPAAPAEKNATPIITSDETVKKNLVELDRLLDTPGSKLEEILRKNMDRIEEETVLKNIPELELVMKEQPWIVPTLKSERHFLLHRYIARRARSPLLRPDVIALDKFLAEHPDIRRPLNRDPSQIVDANFLIAHPSLADFFGQHPVLSTALLIPQGGRRPATKTK
jgi:hypothetical protein